MKEKVIRVEIPKQKADELKKIVGKKTYKEAVNFLVTKALAVDAGRQLLELQEAEVHE